MQRLAVERAARARGDELVGWFEEKRSGKTINRPELDRLRAAVRAGEVRKLYVYRLDRLARSGIRDTFEVVEELRRHGCELLTVADGFDLAGPAAEVVLAVLAWAAKMERLAINERISDARERVEAEGGKWGRPTRIDPATRADIVRRAGSGESVRVIAQAVKVPRSTVGRVLAERERAVASLSRNPAVGSGVENGTERGGEPPTVRK
jgi:DNA invertase Pin-like site-specific DNA recombinase